MIDFAALPPEVNSARMYTGAGSAPMWAASAAWDRLGAELTSTAASYRSVVSGLIRESWLGPASLAMGAAAAPYAAWMSTTAEQARQAANQARSAAAAFEAAFAGTVPPALVAENRAMLMTLVATNILGQNTPAIAATETVYAEMWAQDATTMYGYAGRSAAATALAPFITPPQNTNPGGVGVQAAAVGQAAGSAPANSLDALSQLISTLPDVLQTLASGFTGDVLNNISGWTFVASGVLFILGPVLEGPVAGLVPPASSLGAIAPVAGAAAGLVSADTPVAPGLGTLGGLGMPAGAGRAPVLSGLGRAGSISGLSVPQTWAAAAPEITRAVTAMPEPTLVGLPEGTPDGLGPGYGGMLSGSLMAAAAGGGGAAGGSYAVTRGSGAGHRAGAAAQPGGPAQAGGPARPRYVPPPAVIPKVARALPEGTHGQAAWAGQRAQAGEGALSETLRGEINDLRKQIAELAMEREVLMRSLALWAGNRWDNENAGPKA
jgi:PPE-repeat protein